MEFLELLAFYHWVIIAFGFLLLRVFKLDGLAIPGTFAGVMVAIATFISPDIYWGWQVWGFVFITAISAVPYLRQQQRRREEALDKTLLTQADEAALMVGTSVTVEQPLAPGQGKLLIGGKYWRVAARRDFPAGTLVEVIGHEGAVLNITSSENPSYGISANHTGGEVPVAEYERNSDLEEEYGVPDFDAWLLFQAALKAHSKQSLIHAYHLMCATRGQNLADAKAALNTYTLGLYDSHQEGLYIEMYPEMYCDARHYNFYYGEGHWVGSQSRNFEQEMRKLEAAIETPWADLVRGTIPSEQVDLALRALREKG